MESGGGRIGDAAYAEVVAAQLGSVLKTYLYGAASGPVADHRVGSYESGLKVSASYVALLQFLPHMESWQKAVQTASIHKR